MIYNIYLVDSYLVRESRLLIERLVSREISYKVVILVI